MSSNEKTGKLIQFALLCGLFTWSLLAYAKLGEFMYKGELFARSIDNRPYVSDFANHYNAGVLARKCLDKKVEIYNIDVQNNSLKELIAPVVPEQPFYLQYPPYFFILTLPMSFMNMNIAWLVWNVFGLTLSIFGLWKLTSLFDSSWASSNESARLRKAVFLALCLSSFPAWLSVEIGQTSLYLLAAASFFLYFLLQKRSLQAGLISAFLMVKLQYAPVFFLIGLILGKSKFLIGWLSSLCILVLLSFAILGPENVISYPQHLLSGETSSEVSGVSAFMMQNLRGELVLFFRGDNAAVKVSTLIIFGCATLVSALLVRKFAGTPRALPASLAIAIMIALLTSPHTHSQDYLILSVAAALLCPALYAASSTASARLYGLFFVFPFVSWLFFYIQPFLALAFIQPFFCYVLVMCILSRRMLK